MFKHQNGDRYKGMASKDKATVYSFKPFLSDPLLEYGGSNYSGETLGRKTTS
jgi:hypothetical protein